MSDIGSAQCGDVYVDESDALYRVIQTNHSVEAVTVQRIEGEGERFNHVISGPVGAGAWAGFRRIHRPTITKPVNVQPGYREIGVYLGCPVYVEGGWHNQTYAVEGIKEKLGMAGCR